MQGDMMLTLEQAKSLKHGEYVHEVVGKNADGTPRRWRVSGQVKTWKRSPNRVKVPIKHGMYDNHYITEDNLSKLSIGYGS